MPAAIAAALTGLVDAGSDIVVGTVDAAAVPDATRGWGLRAEGGGPVRILVPDDAPVTLANLASPGRLAVTLTDVDTLRSVQVKGRVLATEAPTAPDLDAGRHFVDRFFGAVERTDGTPRALLERLVPGGFVVVVAAFDEMFDQTPGPSAGAALHRADDRR